MSRKLALGAIWAIVFSPSLIFAQDRKTDPDPAVLPSARTMALAAVMQTTILEAQELLFPPVLRLAQASCPPLGRMGTPCLSENQR